MPEAGRGPDCPLSRREWILGSILLLGLAGLLVYLFDFYALPHNDYVQFTSQAQRLLDLRAPDYYKVLPLYPAVIALVSLLWPGPAAVIHAAQLVSALAALAGAAGLFLFARRYVPWGAPLLVLFVVINPYFLEFATQPLLEMTLLALGTVSLWLAARRHSGGYVAAGFAALTRWDAFFLAPAFAVMRFFESGRRWRYLAGAAAMALPLAWLALSVAHSRQVNPYVEEMIDRSGSTVFWVMLRSCSRWSSATRRRSELSGAEIPLFAGVSILFLAGLVRLWRRDRWVAALLAGYLFSYFSVHGVFGIATYRYHVPLLPLVLFVLFAAIEPKPADGPQPATGLWPGAAWFALAGGLRGPHADCRDRLTWGGCGRSRRCTRRPSPCSRPPGGGGRGGCRARSSPSCWPVAPGGGVGPDVRAAEVGVQQDGGRRPVGGAACSGRRAGGDGGAVAGGGARSVGRGARPPDQRFRF